MRDMCLSEEAQHIVIKPLRRQIMLQRAVAVGNQEDVAFVERCPLGDRQQALMLGGDDDLLALVPTRLVVILDAPGALGLQQADMAFRIGQAVDLRIGTGLLATGNRVAGREDARCQIRPARCSSDAGKISLAVLDGS
jgi:hypothetical protein